MSTTPMFDKPVELALTLNLLNFKDQLPKQEESSLNNMLTLLKSNGKLKYEKKS